MDSDATADTRHAVDTEYSVRFDALGWQQAANFACCICDWEGPRRVINPWGPDAAQQLAHKAPEDHLREGGEGKGERK